MGVHSNELGDFIPPLMLGTFEATIITICFDLPLTCTSQLHNKGMGTKMTSFQPDLRDPMVKHVGAARNFVQTLDNVMDVAIGLKHIHILSFGKHIYIYMRI